MWGHATWLRTERQECIANAKVWRSGTLERAWELVSKNKGAGGVDGVTIERFKGMQDSGHKVIPTPIAGYIWTHWFHGLINKC